MAPISGRLFKTIFHVTKWFDFFAETPTLWFWRGPSFLTQIDIVDVALLHKNIGVLNHFSPYLASIIFQVLFESCSSSIFESSVNFYLIIDEWVDKRFSWKKSPANCCSDFHFVLHKCSRLSQKMHYYSPENSTHLFFKSMNRTFWMHLNFKAHLWVDWWCSRDLDVTSVSNGQSSWNIKTLLGWHRGLRLAYALTDNTKNAGNPILFQSIWGAV